MINWQVDIWSVGCVFAEFLNKQPLFKGKGEMDQIEKIFKFQGGCATAACDPAGQACPPSRPGPDSGTCRFAKKSGSTTSRVRNPINPIP